MKRASELPPGVVLGPHTLKVVLTPAAQSRIFKEYGGRTVYIHETGGHIYTTDDGAAIPLGVRALAQWQCETRAYQEAVSSAARWDEYDAERCTNHKAPVADDPSVRAPPRLQLAPPSARALTGGDVGTMG
jgi:hypothetical protein